MLHFALAWLLLASDGRITVDEFPLPERSPGMRSNASGITAGPDGNLWFTEKFLPGNVSKIGRMTPQGKVTEFPVPGGERDLELYHITTGPDGNLWFITFQPPKVGRVTTDGEVTLFDVPPDFANGLSAIVAGPDGNLWLGAVNDQNIVRFTTEGVLTRFPLSPPGRFTSVNKIAAGPDGNLWYTAKRSDAPVVPEIPPTDLIGRITPEGRITEFEIPEPGSLIPTLSPLLTSIVADRDGNLWFGRQGARMIGRITPRGRIDHVPISLPCTQGLAIGPGGNVWFTDPNYNVLGRITRKGRVTEFRLPEGCVPRSIAVDRDEHLWLPIINGGKILRITLERDERRTP